MHLEEAAAEACSAEGIMKGRGCAPVLGVHLRVQEECQISECRPWTE